MDRRWLLLSLVFGRPLRLVAVLAVDELEGRKERSLVCHFCGMAARLFVAADVNHSGRLVGIGLDVNTAPNRITFVGGAPVVPLSLCPRKLPYHSWTCRSPLRGDPLQVRSLFLL